MKIAVPVTDGVLSGHFGHCEVFYFADVENGKIVKEESIAPPAHEPGLYPKWVKEQGASLVIAGGMGTKAVNLFTQAGVESIVGATVATPKNVILSYLNGSLQSTGNSCNH